MDKRLNSEEVARLQSELKEHLKALDRMSYIYQYDDFDRPYIVGERPYIKEISDSMKALYEYVNLICNIKKEGMMKND